MTCTLVSNSADSIQKSDDDVPHRSLEVVHLKCEGSHHSPSAAHQRRQPSAFLLPLTGDAPLYPGVCDAARGILGIWGDTSPRCRRCRPRRRPPPGSDRPGPADLPRLVGPIQVAVDGRGRQDSPFPTSVSSILKTGPSTSPAP